MANRIGLRIFSIAILLLAAVAAYSSPRYMPGEVIVQFKPGVASYDSALGRAELVSSRMTGIVSKRGLRSVTRVFRGARDAEDLPQFRDTYKLTLSPGSDISAVIEELKDSGDVVYAEPNYIYRASAVPNDAYYKDLPNSPNQWGLFRIGLTPTGSGVSGWDVCRGSSESVIAIVDTGVQWDHPDLAANIWTNPGEIPGNSIDDDGNGYVDDVRGWDFVSVPSTWVTPGEDAGPRDNDPMDFNGHGTHCSGIASAVTDNGIGVAGTGWNCRIMAVRAGFDVPSGDGSFTNDDIAAAIHYAADNGADVISMSFGGPYDSSTISNAVNYAYGKGCFLAAAAGNENTYMQSFPAAYTKVMAVAATDPNDYREDYSNYGDWVDIAAPGGNTGHLIYSTYVGSIYYPMGGTSMATPFVAGLGGLIKAKYPDFTNAQIFDCIQQTADPVNSTGIGAGRINAFRALNYDTYTYIASPAPMSTIYDTRVDIFGSASWEGAGHYTVSTAEGAMPTIPDFVQIEYSTTPVVNGVLASWDNSGLSGPYTIRLSVNDEASRESRITVLLGGDENRVRVVDDSIGGPNPYNPKGGSDYVIHFKLSSDARVQLLIFTLTGKLVLRRELSCARGDNNIRWDGRDVYGRIPSNGVYVYQLATDGMVIGSGKIVILQ